MAPHEAKVGGEVMINESWKQAMDIFSEIVGLSSENRKHFLDDECANNSTLRDQVEELLVNHAAAETVEFLREPAWVVDRLPLSLPDFGDLNRHFFRAALPENAC